MSCKHANVESVASLDPPSLPSPLQSQLLSPPILPLTTPTQDNHGKREICMNTDGQKECSKELDPITLKQTMVNRDIEADWEWNQRREQEHEANLNKFATLFEPSTPRASPTNLPTRLPDVPEDSDTETRTALFDFPRQLGLPCSSLQSSRPSSLASLSCSEFGAFVTTSEDPLSFVQEQASTTPKTTQAEITPSVGNDSTFLHNSSFRFCNSFISHTIPIAIYAFFFSLQGSPIVLVKLPKARSKYDP